MWIYYKLVLILFIASDDGSLARADVRVMDANLTKEDCMEMLEDKNPVDDSEGVWACTLDYDF